MNTDDLFEYQIQKIMELKQQEQEAQKELNSVLKKLETARHSLQITKDARRKIHSNFAKEVIQAKQQIVEVKQQLKQFIKIKDVVMNLESSDEVQIKTQIIENRCKKQNKQIEQNEIKIEEQKQKIQSLNERYDKLNKTRHIAKFTPEKLDELENRYNDITEKLGILKKEYALWYNRRRYTEESLDRLKEQQLDIDVYLENQRARMEEEYQKKLKKIEKREKNIDIRENKLNKLEQQIVTKLLKTKSTKRGKALSVQIEKDVNDFIICDDNGMSVKLKGA